ncbi:MAG: DUF6390 family protein [bacterium]|nr:DUF6390 family protein [bacterium]
MDGVLRSTKYAFGPNRLHLCGPDANSEIFAYMVNGATDEGLKSLLRKFQTMFPYLKNIADANNIRDPFDNSVVEAYWIGNKLLDTISKKQIYSHLKDSLKVNKTLKKNEFARVENKIDAGAKMHHSFHVFNIWKRTGNDTSYHTLDSMDKCRISWGKVVSVDGPSIKVKTEPLLMNPNGILQLGGEIEKKLIRKLNDDYMIDVKIGDIISIHWDLPCEIITPEQKKYLERHTQLSINLANSSR